MPSVTKKTHLADSLGTTRASKIPGRSKMDKYMASRKSCWVCCWCCNFVNFGVRGELSRSWDDFGGDNCWNCWSCCWNSALKCGNCLESCRDIRLAGICWENCRDIRLAPAKLKSRRFIEMLPLLLDLEVSATSGRMAGSYDKHLSVYRRLKVFSASLAKDASSSSSGLAICSGLHLWIL